MCEELQNQPNLTGPHQIGTLFEFWVFLHRNWSIIRFWWVLISTNCDDFHAFQHVFGSIYNVLGSKKQHSEASERFQIGQFGSHHAVSQSRNVLNSVKLEYWEQQLLSPPQTKLTQKTFVSTVVPLPS